MSRACDRSRRTRRSPAGRCAAALPPRSSAAVSYTPTTTQVCACRASLSGERVCSASLSGERPFHASGKKTVNKRADIREKALADLQQSEILMLDGHFDYGNGYHGRVYVNPHQLFRHPSTIWRFAQDLIDLLPADLVQKTEVVAGPVTGGALLAHTMAGLLDSRRSLTHPPCSFAPFNYDPARGFALRAFYRSELAGRRVLLADDVRNTGETFGKCEALVTAA